MWLMRKSKSGHKISALLDEHYFVLCVYMCACVRRVKCYLTGASQKSNKTNMGVTNGPVISYVYIYTL